MSAQIISITSVSRTGHCDWRGEAVLQGFVKALGLVKGLEPANPQERRIAIENWVAAGTLSEVEGKAAADFYGWERGT